MTQPSLSPSTRPYQVIAATDLSDLGDRAIVVALEQAQTHPDSELHVISVTTGDASVAMEHELRKRVEELVVPRVRAMDLRVARISIYLASGSPAKNIVRLAEHLDADLIVMGTHGAKGIKRIVLGSVAAAVVRQAPCGVMVIRPRDFFAGEKVPQIEPELKQGEHALKPFYHAPTHHYVDRAAAASSRMLATW